MAQYACHWSLRARSQHDECNMAAIQWQPDPAAQGACIDVHMPPNNAHLWRAYRLCVPSQTAPPCLFLCVCLSRPGCAALQFWTPAMLAASGVSDLRMLGVASAVPWAVGACPPCALRVNHLLMRHWGATKA